MSTMRRKDREIKNSDEMIAILREGFICHLAMCAEGEPYVVPMVYAYYEGSLYFHCAEVGKKLDMLRQNNRVCFEVEAYSTKIVENGGMPCDWSFAFRSVIGFGNAEIITDDSEEKVKAYDLLVNKMIEAGMAPKGYEHHSENYVPKKIKGSVLIKVPIESMTGKQHDGHKPIPKR